MGVHRLERAVAEIDGDAGAVDDGAELAFGFDLEANAVATEPARKVRRSMAMVADFTPALAVWVALPVESWCSTMSTRRLGSPTCWPACRITPPSAFTNFCRGTGTRNTSPPKLLEPSGRHPTPNYPMAFAGWIRLVSRHRF